MVAVERGDEVIVEFDLDFEVQPDDTVYITGTPEGIATYFKNFPDAGVRPATKLDKQPAG